MDGGSTCGGLSVTHHGRADTSSPTLVLLHGLTDSGDCWPDAVRRWEADYHPVTADARGHGNSPRWSDEELAHVGETMRDDAIGVLDGLLAQGVSRPVVVGHSMGGATAWGVAVARPDLIRALVLEDPAVPSEATRDREAFARRQEEALQAACRADLRLREQRDGPWTWPEIEAAPWARAKQQVDERMLATGVVCLETAWPQVWSAISIPTLVVTGTERVIMDAPRRRAVADLANPHITVHVVPDAGHCVRRCNPEGFHEVVDPFLAAVT
jgi:pimeloyl-ACP methyl ester carboxylesterase